MRCKAGNTALGNGIFLGVIIGGLFIYIFITYLIGTFRPGAVNCTSVFPSPCIAYSVAKLKRSSACSVPLPELYSNMSAAPMSKVTAKTIAITNKGFPRLCAGISAFLGDSLLRPASASDVAAASVAHARPELLEGLRCTARLVLIAAYCFGASPGVTGASSDTSGLLEAGVGPKSEGPRERSMGARVARDANIYLNFLFHKEQKNGVRESCWEGIEVAAPSA